MDHATNLDHRLSETVTASQLNVMIRDDLNYLYSRPYASAAHAQTQDLPSATGVSGNMEIDFGTTLTDTDGMREITSADYPAAVPEIALPTRFLKINTAGKYLFCASVGYQESPAGMTTEEYGVSILRASDAAIIASFGKDVMAPAESPQAVAEVSTLWDSAVGDLFYVTAPYSFSPGDNRERMFPFLYPAFPRFSAQWMGN